MTAWPWSHKPGIQDLKAQREKTQWHNNIVKKRKGKVLGRRQNMLFGKTEDVFSCIFNLTKFLHFIFRTVEVLKTLTKLLHPFIRSYRPISAAETDLCLFWWGREPTTAPRNGSHPFGFITLHTVKFRRGSVWNPFKNNSQPL